MRNQPRNNIRPQLKSRPRHTDRIFDIILSVQTIRIRHNLQNFAICRNLARRRHFFETRDIICRHFTISRTYRDHTVSFRTQDMRTIDAQSRRIHLVSTHTLGSLKRRINRRRRTRQMRHHTLAHTTVGRLTYANDLWCTRTRIDMPNDTPNRLRSDINSYRIAR